MIYCCWHIIFLAVFRDVVGDAVLGEGEGGMLCVGEIMYSLEQANWISFASEYVVCYCMCVKCTINFRGWKYCTVFGPSVKVFPTNFSWGGGGYRPCKKRHPAGKKFAKGFTLESFLLYGICMFCNCGSFFMWIHVCLKVCVNMSLYTTLFPCCVVYPQGVWINSTYYTPVYVRSASLLWTNPSFRLHPPILPLQVQCPTLLMYCPTHHVIPLMCSAYILWAPPLRVCVDLEC